MKEIRFTNEVIKDKYSQTHNLKDLVKLLENEFWSQGHVVCEIYLNNKLIDKENLIGDEKSEKVKELSVKIENLKDLVSETIISTKEHLKKICKFTEDTLIKYLNEEYNQALKNFAIIIENSNYVYESVLLINEQVLNSSLENTHKFHKKWENLEQRMLKVTQELISSFQTEDYILQADILEYEFLEVLNACYEYLAQVLGTTQQDQEIST